MKRPGAVLAAILALPVLAAPSPAVAAAPHAVITTVYYRTFASPIVVVSQGTSLRLVQLDPLESHDVTSYGTRPGGERLFSTSRTWEFGKVADVAGVADLPPGAYDFYCTPHEEKMQGLLLVTRRTTSG